MFEGDTDKISVGRRGGFMFASLKSLCPRKARVGHVLEANIKFFTSHHHDDDLCQHKQNAASHLFFTCLFKCRCKVKNGANTWESRKINTSSNLSSRLFVTELPHDDSDSSSLINQRRIMWSKVFYALSTVLWRSKWCLHPWMDTRTLFVSEIHQSLWRCFSTDFALFFFCDSNSFCRAFTFLWNTWTCNLEWHPKWHQKRKLAMSW